MKTNDTTTFPFVHPHEHGEVDSINSDVATDPSTTDYVGNADVPLSETATAALYALKEELSNIPHSEKSWLVHVQRTRPDLADDNHMMGFLWAENLDAGRASKRLARYWEHRYKVFGPEKFILPMTLNGAMKDHIPVLKQGFISLLPVLDSSGRAIIYSNSSPYKKSIPQSKEKIQVWWYLLHVAMENPSVLNKGFIILANSRESRLNNFDGKWALAACSSGDRDFPIRWRMAHVCHASAVFPLVASTVKAVLSPKQRKSFILHNGSNERVLESLSNHSLPIHCIPTDLGGTLQVSMDAFIRGRLLIEGGASEIDNDDKPVPPTSAEIHVNEIQQEMEFGSDSASPLGESRVGMSNEEPRYEDSASPVQSMETECVISTSIRLSKTNVASEPLIPEDATKKSAVQKVPTKAQKKRKSRGSNLPREEPRYEDSASPVQSMETDCVISTSIRLSKTKIASEPLIPEEGTKKSAVQKVPTKAQKKRKGSGSNLAGECNKTKAKKKAEKRKPHPGRIGDPRMNLAVQTKLNDSNVSLVDALLAGGFVFPDLGKPGIKQGTVKDTDNVNTLQKRRRSKRDAGCMDVVFKGLLF